MNDGEPAYVVDTNVLIVANDFMRDAKHQRAQHATVECQMKSVTRLKEIHKSKRIALDNLGRILKEYGKQKMNHSGQPGIGDYFFKWAFENQANSKCCLRATITLIDDSGGENYEEFPKDAALKEFDRSDRKFVAVVIAARPERVVILNAVDSDWRDASKALCQAGVDVECVCSDGTAAPMAVRSGRKSKRRGP